MLEVLIAIALLSLCLLPLIAPNIEIVRTKRAFTKKMEIAHFAEMLYATIAERLYLNDIPWEVLQKEERIFFTEPFSGSYHFVIEHLKPDDPEALQIAAVVSLFIEINKQVFVHTFFVKIVK